MKDNAFQSAIEALMESGAPRVWSLIVTVFGDLAQEQGAAISGPVLSNILTPLGIKPEAMRVALHRLRNESWLVARKEGRTSLHHLDAYGHAQSAAARRLIYRRANPGAGSWHILCLPQDTRSSAPVEGAYVRLAPGVFLANTPAPETVAPEHGLVFEGAPRSLPAWIMDTALPKGLTSELKDLNAALDIMLAELEAAGPLTPVQSACLRVMIVHRWRRLILKVPDVPDSLFGPDWIGERCRAKVHDALDRLPRPKLSELA